MRYYPSGCIKSRPLDGTVSPVRRIQVWEWKDEKCWSILSFQMTHWEICSSGLYIQVPVGGMALQSTLQASYWSIKLCLVLGHSHSELLGFRVQHVRIRGTILATVIDSNQQGSIGWLLHNGSVDKCGECW
jgi:hypothetical protein